MPDRHHLGELQLAIMRVLWETEGATVQQVHAALQSERGIAASTIGTMLQKMERKGAVRHRRDGRRYVYRAAVTEAAVRRSMVDALTDRLFGGDPMTLLGHLVREEEIDGLDLQALREEIARREKEREEES